MGSSCSSGKGGFGRYRVEIDTSAHRKCPALTAYLHQPGPRKAAARAGVTPVLRSRLRPPLGRSRLLDCSILEVWGTRGDDAQDPGACLGWWGGLDGSR